MTRLQPKNLLYFDFNSSRTNQIHAADCEKCPKASVVRIGSFHSLLRLVKYVNQLGLPIVTPHTCTGINKDVWEVKEEKRKKGYY